MIKVEGLYKQLGGQQVLENISFNVARGEILAVLGLSGAGKTVLLKHLIGLIRPDRGEVIINGVDIGSLSEEKLLKVRHDMGYLFQEGALYDFMDIYDNVAFPLREHTRLSKVEVAARVREVLKLVDLQGVESKIPGELSGGMKKRVGLARAIVLGAKVLLCDEPTSGLDPIRSRDISDLICHVSRQIGSTTVMTSHDVGNALRIATRLLIINECRIAAEGTARQLKESKEPFVQEFLQAATS
ncbi:MAG: ATP-binding cassette domain-containing protein [Candidatus Omnitrophica bacterium]|nr:ATP-binding cassette domain-containing protein [Candidatus Omnitrophota bacterium]MDE2009193.1 ATP-binding cassette domain-containing protein [Candidatus Omnitrophota bacterium]MDE2213714.1 ATP-binding cassette domain-containing protein [Candidatus Omnitrophota bacterium]MDE2230711.1 ATP-binding cassette domain-containing protein [Candidatus Omnitrophota bacterium]